MVFHYGDGIKSDDQTSLSNSKDNLNTSLSFFPHQWKKGSNCKSNLNERKHRISTHSMNTRQRLEIITCPEVIIEKNFQCSLCDKMYTKKNSLKRHIIIYHK